MAKTKNGAAGMTTAKKKKLVEELTVKAEADYQRERKRARPGIRYIAMVRRLGVVEAFTQLLNSKSNRRRPERFGSMELRVREYQDLFNREAIKEANRRLKQIGMK